MAFGRTRRLVPWLVRRLATQAQTASGPVPETNIGRIFKPSREQQAIVEASTVQNVVVSARPGSGKTATAEAIVAANFGLRTVVLTYSKRLQLETARRLEDYPRCDVYTFHGVAGRLYNTVAHNDTLLRSLRREGETPVWTGQPYDIVVLDELQDCTDDLFWLICTFISSITHAAGGKAPKIVALGDERQAIYAFRGADSRYLSLIPSTMANLSPYPWLALSLSKSFRLSEETSHFVNDVFLGGEEYITGTHKAPRPTYLHADLFDVKRLAKKLVPLILQYKPERSAILAPFVRSNRALALLTNYLSERYGIQIAVSTSDDVPLDDLVVGGKLCVSTYHQFKGSERDLVIVYGVDAGYFEFLGRGLPDDRCPNETFVALTRAKKKLVVLHNQESSPMPFMSLKHLPERANYQNIAPQSMKFPQPVGRPLQLDLLLPMKCPVSDMVRHVPEEDMEAIVKGEITIKVVAPGLPTSLHIQAPEITLTDPVKMHYEAVSDINGLAVVAAFEHSQKNNLSTLDCTPEQLESVPSDEIQKAAWFCQEACRYEAQVSGYKSRSIQMQGHAFDWLGPHLRAAKERLTEQLVGDDELQFEARLQEKFEVQELTTDDSQVTRIVGRADIVQHHGDGSRGRRRGKDVTVWEIKFVSKLTLQHAVQACSYAYLWAKNYRTAILPRIVLFNVRDGEKWEITAPGGVAGLRGVIEGVLRAKYTQKGVEPTEVFLKKCAKAREEVERMWKE
ncbi:hypothetical protein SLS62_003390 [Diatrype stigma]|uniref:DNA helicase n=1 Tax=Diatrype stigma TaxID=117547 RepID=A0AAN9YU13_9PEZI